MILNTRPVRYQAAFETAFGSLGHEILPCPMLKLEQVETAIPAPSHFDALIFTSQVAVSFFPPDEVWRRKKVFAVGTATAKAAHDAGFGDVTCTGEDAVDLLGALKADKFRSALFPSAREVAADLSASMSDRVTRVVTYAAAPTPSLHKTVAQRLRTGEFAVVPLFSSRSTRAFSEALHAENLTPANTNILLIAISPAVAGVLASTWPNLVTAPHMTAASMAETAAKHLHARPLPTRAAHAA